MIDKKSIGEEMNLFDEGINEFKQPIQNSNDWKRKYHEAEFYGDE